MPVEKGQITLGGANVKSPIATYKESRDPALTFVKNGIKGDEGSCGREAFGHLIEQAADLRVIEMVQNTGRDNEIKAALGIRRGPG